MRCQYWYSLPDVVRREIYATKAENNYVYAQIANSTKNIHLVK